MINRHKKGFTLIELMIVIVIVAILVGLAVPSFLESVRKSRRSDGLDAIIDMHLEQEGTGLTKALLTPMITATF